MSNSIVGIIAVFARTGSTLDGTGSGVDYYTGGEKAGETVVFSYIVYKSRAHRDSVNAKVMKDPRLADMMDPKKLPFDGKRMFWGGFQTITELAAGH